MTQADVEWEVLQEVWNAPDPAADTRVAALRLAVRRQVTRLRLALVGEVALTLAVFVSLALVWRRAPGVRTAVIIAAALVHTAVIWAFAIRNRRGHWHPRADTVRDAVEARQTHCRRRLASHRFVTGLSAIEGALMALVLAVSDTARLPILLSMAFLAGAVLWAAWDGARLRRELTALDAFNRELDSIG